MTGGPAQASGQDAEELVLRVDGARPLSAGTLADLAALCDRAEDGDGDHVVVHVSGSPGQTWPHDLTIALVTKWEREVRRFERLPVSTIAVADGDCGGPALDVLLATDYRIATPGTRLVLPVSSAAVWPGMALYRLVRQTTNSAAIRRAVLFGTPTPAADGLAQHLLDEVTDDPATALAATRARTRYLSGRELAVRRQLLHDAAAVSFEDALGTHLAACDRTLRRVTAEVPS
ncbi:enoyl-CoA-hydratase DpgB [Streptomyces sp. NPDC007901]|uniref:enoyl-CoA-hydratase DpgB n=1 Tax=Streptomyces sp. NPDC007901 TaxID=3364785 RepID=UPI0036EC991B